MSQSFSNATSNRCWLTTNPHLQMLVLKAQTCIWECCSFYFQKVQLQVPTKTTAKIKSLWISMNSPDKDKQIRIVCAPSPAWYLLQIKATAMRSSLNWHFIPDQFWKRDKENNVTLHANLEGFYIQSYSGRASRITIPETKPFHSLCHLAVNSLLTTSSTDLSSPEDITIKDTLQTCPTYGQSRTSFPGSLTDFPCLTSSCVAWSLAGLAILYSSDRFVFNMLVWCFTLKSNFWKYLDLPTLQNPVELDCIK